MTGVQTCALPIFAPKVTQKLIVAGVLVHQAEDVRAAYLKLGLTNAGFKVQGEWIRLDFEQSNAAAPKAKAAKRSKPKKSPTRVRAEKELQARKPKRR